jgi:anti-sigma B factor antagonist
VSSWYNPDISSVAHVLLRFQADEILSDETPEGVSQALVLNVHGEIRQQVAAVLRETLLELIDRGALELYLDVSDMQHIDSSGVSAIVHITQKMKKAGGQLVIVAASAWIKKVFGVVRTDNLVDVVEKVPEITKSQRSMRTLISKTQSDR